MSEEEIYFEDYHVKITTFRFRFGNETVPIDKITSVYVNHKVVRLTGAFVGFMVTLLSLFLLGRLGVIFVTAAFIWLYFEYTNYVELWITVDNRKIKALHRGISQSQYAYRVDEALNLAIEDNRRLQENGNFEYTDSIRITERMRNLS